jgi:DNA helicase-2/ATP-dependent DNA helicase PcrA
MTRRIDNPDTDADVALRGLLDSSPRKCFVMVAGAGSGKTTSVIKALDHVSKKHGDDLRKRSQKVACITYTEIAVGEIWGDVGSNDLFHVSTIHSFLWSLARPFQKDIAAWVKRRIEEKLLELNQERDNFGSRVRQSTRDRNQRDIARLEEHGRAVGNIKRFKYESGSDYGNGSLGHDDIIKMVPQFVLERPLLGTIIAQKYPFFFIDESQDTFPQVVAALKVVARQAPGRFCVGFIGDPMQQIYVHGVGDIPLEEGWQRITKPENFRCPVKVLSTINRIRADGDGLKQTRGRQYESDGVWHAVEGAVDMFVLPANAQRDANLARVRSWLATKYSDALWTSDSKEADVRVLVIVHRMAAARLGFLDLYGAFHDDAPESFSTGFREGNAWALKPFLEVLVPLVRASALGQRSEVMRVLRTYCPLLDKEYLHSAEKPAEILASLKESVDNLACMTAPTSNSSVLDVLQFAERVQLLNLDERIKLHMAPAPPREPDTGGTPMTTAQGITTGEDDKEGAAMKAYFACPAKQLMGYLTYINDESPYSTQQGIKGAEFERVIVIIDDEEGRHFQFSYDKLLGLKEPSRTDLENRQQGKETILDRTRRLFYVCCSRARKGLAIVLYAGDVQSATTTLKNSGLVDATSVYTLDTLS